MSAQHATKAKAPTAAAMPKAAPRAMPAAQAPLPGNQIVQQALRVQGPPPVLGGRDDPQEDAAEHMVQNAFERFGPGDRRAIAGLPRAFASIPRATPSVLRTSGVPLDAGTRLKMEQRLRADFSDVRIHTAAPAAQSALALNASAYTLGSDIAFAPGRYVPDSAAGERLLAHELAHVAQREPMPVIRRAPAGKTDPATAAPTPVVIPERKEGEEKKDDPPKLILPPDPKGQLVENVETHVTFSKDLEYVRFQLQNYASVNGTETLGRFINGTYIFGNGLGPFLRGLPTPATPENQAYLGETVILVVAEAKALKDRLESFTAFFQGEAVTTLNIMLDESEARVIKERKRYGLDYDQNDNPTMGEDKQAEELASLAGQLRAKFDDVQSTKTAYEERREITGEPGYTLPGGVPEQSEIDKTDAARSAYEKAKRDYAVARGGAERRHPILVAYQLDANLTATGQKLDELSSAKSSDQAGAVAKQIETKLDNIDQVREDVGNDNEKIWELDAVVETTRRRKDVLSYEGLSPGIEGARIAEERGKRAAEAELVEMFTAIGILALGFVAAIPTGGLSLAGVAAVEAAGAAESGLMTWSAYKSYQKFSFDMAASGTDFDKAKAISQNEPSLLWLAFDLVGNLLPVAGKLAEAAGIFEKLAAMRKAAAAAKSGGKLTEASEKLVELAEAGDNLVKKGVGEQLRASAEKLSGAIESQGKRIEEIEKNLGKAEACAEAGCTRKVPIEGEKEHFWKQSEDGTWCRYSDTPEFCLISGTPEAEAINEDLKGFEEAQQAIGPNAPYETTEHLKKGNFGEREAARALSEDGHSVLSFKPEITGTNQGGIDIVTMKNGKLYLVDNKAYSTGRDVGSVSALDKNFNQNLAKVRSDFAGYAADMTRSKEERDMFAEAVKAIDGKNYEKVVTTFPGPFTQPGMQSTGITPGLAGKGFTYIDLSPYGKPVVPPVPAAPFVPGAPAAVP